MCGSICQFSPAPTIQTITDDGVILPSLQGFANANWGPQDASIPTQHTTCQVSLMETCSICGHLLFLCGAPILWKSQKELHNSHSSCESEIKATDECTKNVRYIRNILTDLSLLDIKIPTTIYNDNRGAVNWSNTTSNKNMRHVNIHENSVREAIHEFHEVRVEHIGGQLNLSNLFTKEFKSDEVFCCLRDLILSPRLDGGCWG